MRSLEEPSPGAVGPRCRGRRSRSGVILASTGIVGIVGSPAATAFVPFSAVHRPDDLRPPPYDMVRFHMSSLIDDVVSATDPAAAVVEADEIAPPEGIGQLFESSDENILSTLAADSSKVDVLALGLDEMAPSDGIGQLFESPDEIISSTLPEDSTRVDVLALGLDEIAPPDGSGGTGQLFESPDENILSTLTEDSTAVDLLALASEEVKGTLADVAAFADSSTAVAEADGMAPSVRKIIKFAIPAIGVWLCGPILSLIDTSAVGLLSGTAQQAALNPAVAITDYSCLLLAFLYTATTNLVASARAADHNIEGKPRTAKTLMASLQLSGLVGTGLAAALIIISRTLVRTMIGNDAIDPDILSAALKYVRIRALGMPAAAVIGSAQSACLGMQDIKSPLYVLLAAAVVNFFGDMLFVGSTNPLLGGAAGAAWATIFSQYAALGMFMKWLRSKPPAKKEEPAETIDLTNAIMDLTGSGKRGAFRRVKFRNTLKRLNVPPFSSSRSRREQSSEEQPSFSTRGFLSGRMRKRDLFSFPAKDAVEEFLPYVLPVTTTSIGRVSSYAAMSHVVSSSLGTAAMAAQQVVLSLFYCLTPIADSLGLTAQSFVPEIFSQADNPNRAAAVEKTTKNFVKAGGIFGAVMVAAVGTIPIFSKYFTSDAAVIAMVNSVAPLLAIFFASHGIFSASEGLLLGQKDLGFLGKSYAAFFAIVPALMLQVKRAALSGVKGVGLTTVWKIFVGYQLFRVSAWGLRIMQLQKRIDRTPSASLGAH